LNFYGILEKFKGENFLGANIAKKIEILNFKKNLNVLFLSLIF
jgi:hypothetical protein